MVAFGPSGMRRARPPGATPPFDYRGANVADWPPGPETIRRLKELLAKLEAGGGGQDVINAVEAKIIQLGPRGSRPVTTPPTNLRQRAARMSQSPSPGTIARAVPNRAGGTGSLVAQSKVQASERMKAAWKKLLTPGEHLEVQAGVERHLRSIKPQQMQMLMPAGTPPETLPQGVSGPTRPGTGLRGITPNDWLANAGTGNPTSRPGGGGGVPPGRGTWQSTGWQPTGSGPGAVVIGDESIEALWQHKLSEAKRPAATPGHGSGLYESIKAEGVRPVPMQGGQYTGTPIEVGHQPGGLPRRIMEGHHRVAAAADINPAMEVPIANRPYQMWGADVVMPDRRIKQIVPNEDIVKQLAKFSRKWGKNALRLMMKIPK